MSISGRCQAPTRQAHVRAAVLVSTSSARIAARGYRPMQYFLIFAVTFAIRFSHIERMYRRHCHELKYQPRVSSMASFCDGHRPLGIFTKMTARMPSYWAWWQIVTVLAGIALAGHRLQLSGIIIWWDDRHSSIGPAALLAPASTFSALSTCAIRLRWHSCVKSWQGVMLPLLTLLSTNAGFWTFLRAIGDIRRVSADDFLAAEIFLCHCWY